jgi:hypothetical protein
MYTISTSAKLDQSLSNYLNSTFVTSFKLEKIYNKDMYTYIRSEGEPRVQTGGIHSNLKSRYYPKYKYKHRRTRVLKKGSSKKEGIKVGKQIEAYIVNGKRPGHRFARKVIKFLEKEKNHTILACEVPVYVSKLGCATQADIITSDPKQRLWMWELKCGSPNTRSQGKLRPPLNSIGNSRLAHWELQRHFTFISLVEGGVNLYKSAVLQVYDEYKKSTKQKVVSVKARLPSKWAREKLPKLK